jgi:hypothetical protein
VTTNPKWESSKNLSAVKVSEYHAVTTLTKHSGTREPTTGKGNCLCHFATFD